MNSPTEPDALELLRQASESLKDTNVFWYSMGEKERWATLDLCGKAMQAAQVEITRLVEQDDETR